MGNRNQLLPIVRIAQYQTDQGGNDIVSTSFSMTVFIFEVVHRCIIIIIINDKWSEMSSSEFTARKYWLQPLSSFLFCRLLGHSAPVKAGIIS